MRTDQLLAESLKDAEERESTAFGHVVSSSSGNIVLFGAGSLGRKALSALRAANVEPIGFADTNAVISGQSKIDNLAVLPLGDAVHKWGRDALFVATVFRPGDGEGMRERLRMLNSMGCRWTSSFLPLAWKFKGLLPHFGIELPSSLLRHASSLREVATLWHDEASAETFRQQLLWRLRADFNALDAPSAEQYYPRDLITVRSDERIIDGGAFDGDSLRRAPNGYERAWAFEPDPVTADKLRANVDSRVTVYQSALGNTSGRIHFNSLGNMASARSESGNVEVELARLDDLFADEGPTFIKLDVEGDEISALEGGIKTIVRHKPVIAVCAYHKPSHLWEIPTLLHDLLPEHCLHLKCHEFDGFELVVYAVPKQRSITKP